MQSDVGAYNASDIRSLLHVDHEQIGALTEQRDAMAADFVARKEKLLPADGGQIKKAA